MPSFTTKAALAPAALSVALMLSVGAPASAQSPAVVGGPNVLTNGPAGAQPNTLLRDNKGVRRTRNPLMARRPLTVRRAGAAYASPAGVPAPAPAATGGAINPITGVLGIGSTVVGLPFQVLGGIFPSDLNARKGGVTAVPYQNAKPKVAEIDEGWAMAVPVDRSGPTYVVENGDPSISPLVLIGLPLRAVGTLAQTPFRVLASPFGGLPGL